MADKRLDGDVEVNFTEAQSRQSLDSGESVKTLFGKLRKWLSDLKPVAFSGSYKDLINTPTLGSAASKNVPSTGNASTSEVVMGNDSRLSNSRPASDVSAWAKAATKPTYTASEVGLNNVGNFKAVSTVASQGLTDTEKTNARTNIGAGNQVTLTGSVTGSASFVDGNTAAITTNLKSCNVGNTTGTAHPGWYKVAESNVFTGNIDKTLLLYAERGIKDNSTLKSGLLKIHVRSASNINNAPATMRAQWSDGTFTISKDTVALTYSKTNHVATLWIYLDVAFDTWRFTVLSESSGFDRANNSTIWTLYNTRYADAQSSLPDSSDNTITYSIPGQLDNLGYYGLAGRSTNTTTNPWALIAEANALANNNLGLTLLFDYTFTPSDHTVSTGTGILTVNVRSDANNAIVVDRSYVKWLTKTNEINDDDVIVTYNNNTGLVQVWGKSDYPYKAIRVRPLSGGAVSTFDVSKWTITRALNTNLYESYPTGDGITVLTPTCDIQERIECIDINAAYVPATGEVHITNTSDFTQQLFSKLYVYDEVRFAVLNLSVTSSTYYLKAIINIAAITHAHALEATFINDDTLYKFY